MSVKIIRHSRDLAGYVIEIAGSSFQSFYAKAANENRRSGLSPLSWEEAEIVMRLATGQHTAAIADRLEINDAAVKEHIRSMLRKLRTRPKS
jgi:DNA-binding NarL/FixJ family response regulator